MAVASIVDYLKSKGQDSSYKKSRKPVWNYQLCRNSRPEHKPVEGIAKRK